MQTQFRDAIMGVFESEIRLEEAQTRKLRESFNLFMRELIPILKEDKTIGALFEGVQQVGSSATKLRVQCFDEFDVNILLKSTFLQVSGSSSPGFVYLEIDESAGWREPHTAALQALRNLRGYQSCKRISPLLLVDKLQSAVDTAVKRLRSQSCRLDVVRVSRREGRPAVTLEVRHEGRTISIDLVPVFQFPWPAFPAHCRELPHVRQYLTRDLAATSGSGWAAVPKSALKDSATLTWRLHVEELERCAMQDKRLMKDGIRLLKHLRNCQGGQDGDSGTWLPLTSQMIKTACLWEDESSRGSLWNKDIAVVLVTMIGALEGHLRNGALRDFWFNTNYLDSKDVSRTLWDNMADRLRRIRNGLEGPDPVTAVQKYFRK